MGYRVTAAAVQVAVGSRVHMIYQGRTVPEGVAPQVIESLLAKGLIAEATAAPAAKADKVGTDEDAKPDKSWSNEKIAAYAAEHSIDLGEATVKKDMLAVIAAASE